MSTGGPDTTTQLASVQSIISLVADILASSPSNHVLLGGNEAAIKWLSRFLALLPAAPESPLPLLTAPVLDAFLTGAGHMLANKHANEFTAYLETILNDVLPRLDVGSIGAPSATRLKKTVAGGFDAFKHQLPSKALADLYYGASGTSVQSKAPFSSSGSTTATETVPALSNPFSAPAKASPFQTATTGFAPSPFVSSTSNPFQNPSAAASSSQPAAASSTASAPFGATSSASTFPFGVSVPTNPTTSPFGTGFGNSQGNSSTGMDDRMDSGTFSANMGLESSKAAYPQIGAPGFASQSSTTTMIAPAPSPFSQTSSSASPFGSSVSNSSPGFSGQLGGAGFGFAASSSTPFPSSSQASGFSGAMSTGAFGQTSSQTPFTQSFTNPAASGSAAFGSSLSTPFGQQAPFGNQLSTSSPFGTQSSSSSFAAMGGLGGQQNASVFGGGASDQRPPCHFFAKGTCKNGAACRFSHAGSSQGSNPFGGPRR